MSSITRHAGLRFGESVVVPEERATVRAEEEVPVFRAASGLFTAEGVPADLVRAGEPRLRRYAVRDTAAPALARTTSRAPRLRRVLRAATS